MARKSRTIKKISVSISGAELKRQLEFERACKRYRINGFLDYVTGGLECSPVPPGYPEGYQFTTHWRDLVRDLTDVLSDNELSVMVSALRHVRHVLPLDVDAIRERLK